MKKTLSLVLTVILLLTALSGCASDDNGESLYKADNEILYYEKIDSSKTQLVVSRTGNIPVEMLCNAFQNQNPDIQVIFLDITGGITSYKPIIDWIENGDMPDVVITGADFFDEEHTLKYFINLSDYPLTQEYETAALQRTATESNVYWLPGPSDTSAIMYNKTLFNQYGWEVPKTFDEFIALCDKIKADTNGEIEAFNPNAKYGNELKTLIEAITYEEIFGGPDNRTWYNGILNGEGSFTGHMEPYVEVMQTLIDHGLLRKEHLTYSATTRGKEFAAGQIAMINGNIYNAVSDEFEFSLMPFPSTTGDVGYVCDSYSCYVGIPIKEHTKKQQEAVDRFIEFFSSKEGQLAYIGNSLKISNVKGVSVEANENLEPLSAALQAGHMFSRLDFYNEESEISRVDLHNIALQMLNENKTAEECLAEIDKRLSKTNESPSEPAKPPVVLGTVTEEFTVLETSLLIADAYREASDADIGLIQHNAVYRGNLMRLYPCDITADVVTVLMPRSFANGSKLVKVSMSGEQLIKTLNNPLGDNKLVDCIYAFSGLVCEVAPTNELGSKYLSVKLSDGTDIKADKLYTVAFWEGTVDEAYITEVLETYELSWQEVMTQKITADKELAPAEDGRLTLKLD